MYNEWAVTFSQSGLLHSCSPPWATSFFASDTELSLHFSHAGESGESGEKDNNKKTEKKKKKDPGVLDHYN